MTIVNGGYAKITKRVYQIEFRGEDGCSWGDYVHASNRREAMSFSGRQVYNKGGKIIRVISEDDMNQNDRDQAHDWLYQRGAYTPNGGSYATRNECFGPF